MTEEKTLKAISIRARECNTTLEALQTMIAEKDMLGVDLFIERLEDKAREMREDLNACETY